MSGAQTLLVLVQSAAEQGRSPSEAEEGPELHTAQQQQGREEQGGSVVCDDDELEDRSMARLSSQRMDSFYFCIPSILFVSLQTNCLPYNMLYRCIEEESRNHRAFLKWDGSPS